MKKSGILTITGFLLIGCLFSTAVFAEDMREMEQNIKEKKRALLEKVEKERRRAEQEALETRQRILNDEKRLLDELEKLKSETGALEKGNEALLKQRDALQEKETELSQRLEEVDAVISELAGVIRIYARDLDAMMKENLQTAMLTGRGEELADLTASSTVPGMDDIRHMVDLYFEEIERSGEVRVEKGHIINRAGEKVAGEILLIGNFTAAYQLQDEAGFLKYSPAERRLFALTRLPPRKMRKAISAYMAGMSADAPVDVSRGGALRQLSHRISFPEQIKKGGPIVWPIIAILFLSVFIALERMIFLKKKNIDMDAFMRHVNGLVSDGKWDECRRFCGRHHQKPISSIILAGMSFKDMKREDMENAIQETILREIPPLERFLSTLGMLAAIAPLLGLLGTVTGMINTFHVITYYGAGDPRMMSGGISEALVTTMLGLMVAIPIMLGHTLLSRRIENMISALEEKAVSFINTVYKTRANV